MKRSPSKKELKEIKKLFPDARIEVHVEKGHKLSDELQDGKSYVYAIINVGARIRKVFSSVLKR